jgi:hypothetical protein
MDSEGIQIIDLTSPLNLPSPPPTEVDFRFVSNGIARSSPRESPTFASAASVALRPGLQHPCTACTDSFSTSNLFCAPCGHYYCADCITILFETATKDESRFPPQCCAQPIPLAPAKLYLPRAIRSLFELRAVEFSTPNRTYCSDTACHAFIDPAFVVGATATCQRCQQQTCATCKRKAHEGDCPQDNEVQKLVETASRKGWQRCYNCCRIVERLSGCNHMTLVLPHCATVIV